MTFNIDFLAQNINIKLVGFWVSLRFCFLFFPHLSSHHKDVTFFTVWKTFSLFSCLYEDNFDAFLYKFMHWSVNKPPFFITSIRKCLLVLLLSNALKWRFSFFVGEVLQRLKAWSPNGYLLLTTLLYNISP